MRSASSQTSGAPSPRPRDRAIVPHAQSSASHRGDAASRASNNNSCTAPAVNVTSAFVDASAPASADATSATDRTRNAPAWLDTHFIA